MSGMMLNVVGGSYGPGAPTVIGEAFGGGFYAGQIGVSGVATHYIIVGPRASAENSSLQYKNAATSNPGAGSVIDGPQNTTDMVDAGDSSVYPAAHFCNNLSIGGFDDWYLPAINELEVVYFNLKPSTASNNTGGGTNTNAVPSRGSNYTAGTPAQTSVAAFQEGGSEAFSVATPAFCWSSTKRTDNVALARQQTFSNGEQDSNSKDASSRVRAIRRIPV